MKRLLLASVALAGCGSPPPSAPAAAPPPPPADIVLENGDVHTMVPAAPRAKAIAIRDSLIVFVGADAKPYVGPKTRVVDLRGRTVAPAMTDAHAHLHALGDTLDQPHLWGCTSADDCARRLVPSVDGARAGRRWIRGGGWDQNRFPDKQFPTHAALDRIAKDVPIWVHRVDGHAGWANAEALAQARIDKKTPDPPGGKILRDASGEATGVLVDNAMALVERVVPQNSDAENETAILRAQDVVLEKGLTEVHEMGIGPGLVALYRRLAREQKLKVRVYAFAAFEPFDGEHEEKALAVFDAKPDASTAGAMFTLRGVKMFADGALGSRGAALIAPYTDDPKTSGLLVTPQATLERAAKKALATGWQLAVHAIGDRANRLVLDAFQAAGCASAREHRFRIEHAQVFALGDIGRLRPMGVIASMQPKHATSDMGWAEARLGPTRLLGAYAWRRLLATGTRVAWGSDFPVEGPSLVENLHAATTRTDADGKPAGGWMPDQKITLDEALAGFSSGAAFAAFEDGWRGQAALGQAADLTVFDRELTPATVGEAKADLTIVGGVVRYERSQ